MPDVTATYRRWSRSCKSTGLSVIASEREAIPGPWFKVELVKDRREGQKDLVERESAAEAGPGPVPNGL